MAQQELRPPDRLLSLLELDAAVNGAGLTPGDANGDGKVDEADAVILAGNWQKTDGAAWNKGDFNLDGMVNDADATILASHWQAGVGASQGFVPEPGSLLMLLAGLFSVLTIRRRK